MPDIYVAPKKRTEKPVSRSEPKKEKVKKQKVSEKPPIDQENGGSLSAFVAKPKDIRFETQEREEKIVLLLRRHWITNVSWFGTAILMLIAPTLLRYFPLFDFLPERFRFILVIAWYLLTAAFTFEKFLSWFFNVNIITDERIIDIDFPTILYRDISSTKIDQVQDISIKVGGFARSLFDYGDVMIQTAGAVPEFCFEAVPHPTRVAEVLNELILEEEQEKLDGRVR